MTGSPAAMRSRFIDDGVANASPQVLLMKLYDRLVLDLTRAEYALRASDRQVAHDQLINAQGIVSALSVALDGGEWDGTATLQAVYRYLLSEMVLANVHQEPERVAACLVLVEPLRNAWADATAELNGTTSTVTPGAPAPRMTEVTA